jgi:hypothetical protein
MTGEGPFAQLLAQRFEKACERFGFRRKDRELRALDTTQFTPPSRNGQASLF